VKHPKYSKSGRPVDAQNFETVNYFKFTMKKLDELPDAKPGKRDVYHDTKVPDLKLRITPNGVKSFFVRKRVNRKYVPDTLGHYPAMSITQARSAARTSLNTFSAGVNPNTKKINQRVLSITLKEVMSDYVDSRNKTLKEKTIRDYQILFNGYLSEWSNKELVGINRTMVVRKHKKIGEKTIYRANATMRLLRALFNYAIGEYENADGNPIIQHNPVQKISHNKGWFREKPRTNIIEPNDLKAWFEAVRSLPSEISNLTHKNSANTVRDYLILLLFTGLRPSEGINLEWGNIDFNNKLLTIEDTKNHEDHTLPLTEYIVDLLRNRQAQSLGRFVFPGFDPNKALVSANKQVKKVIRNSGVEFLLHDLRRTFATYADSLEIQHTTIKRLMNHKDKDVTSKHYIQPSIERLREPMNKITDYILGQVK